jgi:hypothetical protein
MFFERGIVSTAYLVGPPKGASTPQRGESTFRNAVTRSSSKKHHASQISLVPESTKKSNRSGKNAFYARIGSEKEKDPAVWGSGADPHYPLKNPVVYEIKA